MESIKCYTVEELCNENKQIIILSQDGVMISIKPTPEGTSLHFVFGNRIVVRTYDYLVPPVKPLKKKKTPR